MDEKHDPPRLRAPSSTCSQPARRPRLAALGLLGIAATAWYCLPPSALADLSFPSVSHIASKVSPLRQKQFAQNEQAALQNIPLLPRPGPVVTTEHPDMAAIQDDSKVRLEAHIMSKCPDARDCIQQLVVPAMERTAPLVNFTLSFIGDAGEGGDDSRITCKHGPTECLGNMLMLCADDLYPEQAVISLGFANCLIGDYKHIPHRELVEQCAMEHAVDFDELNKCVSDGGRGEELLKRSMRWSKSEGVTYSCTIRLEGKEWCVRDDGQWKGCDNGSDVGDLVGEIKRLAEEKHS